MSRSELRRLYNIAIVAALLVGFGLGYALRGGGRGGTIAREAPEGVADKLFPGCRAKYVELKRAFAYGPYVRVNYADVIGPLKEALKRNPGYLPYHSLLGKLYEDWSISAARPDLTDQDRAIVAQGVGLPPTALPAELAAAARKAALKVWEEAGEYALVQDVAKFGPEWRALRDQNLSALRDRREFRVNRSDDGALDLVEVYNLYGVTRDHDRNVNNLSAVPQGFSFEEKHMPDILYCPQHPNVPFHFPCVQVLPSRENATVREDLEFFRTVFGIDGQKLSLEDAPAKAVHLLCFSVAPTGSPVTAVVQLTYSGGREEAHRVVVGPWRQSDRLLRDPAARRELDAAYRDSELHKCNGEEFEMANAPAYLYHVTVPADPTQRLDRVSFPRYDPTTTGLGDPGIRDVRIVAITLE